MAIEPTRVGVASLGQIGSGIARNLAAAGFLAAALDTNPDLRADISVPMLSGQALVDRAHVIPFAVPSTAHISDCLSGCTGSDTTIIDLTTSDPAKSTALADDLAGRGFSYIDAAMTGGAAGADAGTLTLMARGHPDTIDPCKPIFDEISSRFFHVGPVGSSHAMKLVHNLILHSAFMATCEDLRLAERAGPDVNAAVNVLNAGKARSFVTEVRYPRNILSGTMVARSTVANLEKDLRLAVEFAQKLSGPAPYRGLTLAILNQARKARQADTECSHIFALFAGLTQQMAEAP